MPVIRFSVLGLLLAGALPLSASAQYVPPNPGSCATGFNYSAGMCVPRGGGATNAYRPPRPESCATGYTYSASMCVPRR